MPSGHHWSGAEGSECQTRTCARAEPIRDQNQSVAAPLAGTGSQGWPVGLVFPQVRQCVICIEYDIYEVQILNSFRFFGISSSEIFK